MQRLVLRKTPPEEMATNPKLPYFKLSVPPEQDGDRWIDVGVLWKSKSGNGYSGNVQEGITIVLDNAAREQARVNWKAQRGSAFLNSPNNDQD